MSPDLSAAPPRANWIARYAARLLQLSPELRPLEAVRRALDASALAGTEDPDEAALVPVEDDPARPN